MLTREHLQRCTIPELKQLLDHLQVVLPSSRIKKDDLITFILQLKICYGCKTICHQPLSECNHYHHKICSTTNNEGFLSCPECFIPINLTTNELEEMYNLQQAKHLS
jgi:hypothetical protein